MSVCVYGLKDRHFKFKMRIQFVQSDIMFGLLFLTSLVLPNLPALSARQLQGFMLGVLFLTSLALPALSAGQLQYSKLRVCTFSVRFTII